MPTSEIVDCLNIIRARLRAGGVGQREVWEEWLAEAVAEIERLRAENAMLAEMPQEALNLMTAELRSENERLRAALTDALTGINHVALYKADNWPDPGTDHMEALSAIGAGQSYDLWCCWNAGMRARRALEPKP